jgi:LysR family hydrogen peroxide-inducible transcriptional activator
MNINQLIYLKELVHYGSFTMAARKLDISQPALSAQIRKLEEEAGLVLIDRRRKPIQLTKDGEAYYDRVTEILERIEELRDLPFQLSNEIKGELNLGIIPTLAPYLITLFIDELDSRFPSLHVTIEELITEVIIQRIKTGHLDAGIISTPVEVSNLYQEPLFYEQFFLYLSDKHPLYKEDEITLDDIDMDEIWYLKEGNCFTNQVDAICRLAGKSPGKQNLVYYSDSIESLRRIVESKHGITFIPELATMQIPSEMEDMIKPISGFQPAREISLVSGSFVPRRRLLDAFKQVALSQLPARMKNKPDQWIMDTDIRI